MTDEYIDIYCERTGSEIWSEPLNALSNVGFIIAALAILFMAKRESNLKSGLVLLALLCLCIGLGSGLFHLYATHMTMLADVLPIFLFEVSFIIVYSHRVMNLQGLAPFRLMMGFVVLTILCGYIPKDFLNGSMGYFPALIFLGGLGIYHYITRQPAPLILLSAGVIFCLSLIFRSIDMYICGSMSIGTHFMWNVLNSIVLYISMYSILLKERQAMSKD